MGKIKLLLGAFFVFFRAAISAAPIYFDFTDEKYTFLNGKEFHFFEINGEEVLEVAAGAEGGSYVPTMRWTPNGLGIGGPFSGQDVLCENEQNPFAVDERCIDEAFYVSTRRGPYVLNSAIFAKADSDGEFGASMEVEGEQFVHSPGEVLIRCQKFPGDCGKYLNIIVIWPLRDSSYVLQGISIGIPEELDAYYLAPAPPAIWIFGTGLICLFGFSKRRKAA